ncbi:MAG: branched-chain amino acid ABC transporter substrate-binding protein [Rickettsiales bacterium]|nr:branched-chain amino acid ABC transporter substrate-binding protein [Rickettsiales bacterium]OUW70783.1 MAG: branched-chain amino acid ABC transporter substrate-binding protein [Rickettsiales bacterium TMED211]
MSIQQLEERKKIDLERKKKRDDRGSKKFAKDIKLTTDIIFITKEREVPAVLSNLDPILNDEGFYGIQLGVEDNLTTGRFLGHDYKVKMIQVSLKEDLEEEFKKLIKSGYTYFVADLNSGELSKLSNLKESKNILLINIRSKEDSLRNEFCKTNLIHVAPSYTMLSDALTQYLVKKKWKKWFLVIGPEKEDKAYADALKKSAKKFNIKIKEERVWDFASDLRRTAQKEIPIFTKGVNYDIMVVADEKGEFGEYLSYRTWDPRLIVGSQGLKPTNWHRTHEQWGATQMQNRFRRKSGRWMTPVDYSAWVAVRAIGEAVSRVQDNKLQSIKEYLFSEGFGIGAYKGVKVSFRNWNGQLRQPILLAAPRSMVSVSPQEGYLHPTSELDTLGVDEPESSCKF